MISDFFTKILLAQYIVIALVSLCERNPVRSMYWVGAAILNGAIILGMK